MSDKFEEWLEEEAEGGVHLRGLTPEEYGLAVFIARQQKIDKLESLLKEAVTALRVVQDVEKIKGNHYITVDYFLNKPEIKKLRGER